MLYSQCTLVKRIPEGTRTTVAYIPSKYATVGKYVKIRQCNGMWENGWEVTFAGEPTKHPMDYRKAIRNHRHNTGDSSPKMPS